MGTAMKPVLTVMFTQTEGSLLASGVREDVDMFRNVYFASLNEALVYLNSQYQPEYTVILNIPANVRR